MKEGDYTLMSQTELPEFVKKKLEYLSQKIGVSFEQLESRYWEIYNDPWLQQDPSFRTPDERHAYAVRILWVEAVSRPPSKEFYVIPFGYTGVRISKSSGVPMSRIYVLQKDGDQWKKNVIVCKEKHAYLYRDIRLFYLYKAKLFDTGGVLMPNYDTSFNDPKPLNLDPLTLVIKSVGVDVFKLIDVHKHVSRKQNGFIDEFDIKGLYGIVVRWRKGKRQDGTEYGFYVVSDDSVGLEDTADEEGRIIPAQFTVWIAPELVKYDERSEIFVYGTVSVGSDGVPFMNAYGVIPIHARPIPEVV